MNYIYYNEFGKEVKKLIMPIAKGSSNIKIIIFSDLDNMASSPYKVTAAFKRADGLVAGDIALSNSVDKKTNPYNQVEMYYRELVIGNDLTELVGGLELSLKYVTTESIEVEPNVFYDEDTIRVQAMAVFNIYNAVSFITPPQNTQLVNLRNYVDAQNIIIFNEYDGKLFLKADKIDTYLKSEVYNKDESYNKTEINNLNDLKANASEVFSKEETYNRDTINDLVADVPNKANIVILQSITTQPATATVGQIYYNAYDKKIYLYDGSDWGVNNVGANGILYMFNNVLYVYNTYDGLIKIGQKPLAFDTLYVDSLSSNINDFNYLTVENQIIANSGIDVKSHKIINVQDPTTNQDAATKKYVDDSIITVEGGLNNYYTKVQTYSQDEINSLIASNYKAKGNLAPAGLVAGLLIAANLGNVYNITGQFTTTSNFLEGAGKVHEAGENVVIVEYSAGVYKFDVLSSFVDLSGYVEKDGSKVLSDNNFTTTLKDKLDGAEITSNKVSSWSPEVNDTKYPSEKLVKDSLDAINVGLENIGSLSPLRFAGYFTGGTVTNDFNNLIRPFENLTNPLPDFYLNNVQGAMFVCSAASDFVFNTVYFWSPEEGTDKTTPITFNWAAPYDEGIGTTNFEVGDTISILKFAYDTVENEMRILIKVEKNLEKTFVVKNESITPATKAKITYDAKGLVTAGADLTADDIPTHQHTKSEITDFPTIPANKSYSKTITTANWTDKKYAVTISGLEVSDTVLLSGADDIFTTNGLTATITANTLTFEVETLPTVSIDVNFTVIKTEGGTL